MPLSPLSLEPAALAPLIELLRGKRLAVLTGAGMSTESGIPDYREPETRRRARKPIRFVEYAASSEGRARYWARSMLGWARFSRAEPHAGHGALVQLEKHGQVLGIITQNVDSLHQAAGNQRVIELHGALSEVRCLRCGEPEPRDALQARLERLNPHMAEARAALAPDGDADLGSEWLSDFRVANCLRCDGVLKPNVVFFGESVPRDRVHAAASLVEAADALLVLGSSLAVYSGYRFVKRAHELGRAIGLVTLGETRADGLVHVRIESKLQGVLPALARSLMAASSV